MIASYGPVARIITSIRDGLVGLSQYDGAIQINRTWNTERRCVRHNRASAGIERAVDLLTVLPVLTVQVFRLR